MLECTIITSQSGFESLAGEWRELQKAVGNTPFTDYEWFDAWWRHLGNPLGKTLHIVTARDGGKLVGILPLAVHRRPGLRILQGAGLEAFFLSDLLAVAPEHAQALWDAARCSGQYDFAMIRDVDAQSLCGKILSGFAHPCDTEKAPCVDVQWTSGKEWLAAMPKKFRHEHQRLMRRLEEKGRLKIQLHTEGPIPVGIVEGMVKQKIDWCIKNGKRGLFDHAGVMDFFKQITETMLANNSLFLGWIECGGSVVAYTMGCKKKQIFFDYFVTFDPQWMTLSPGNVVLTETIAWVIDNGFHEFNFLQGDGKYKQRLTNSERVYTEWVFAPSVSGAIKERIYIKLRALRRQIKNRRIGNV